MEIIIKRKDWVQLDGLTFGQFFIYPEDNELYLIVDPGEYNVEEQREEETLSICLKDSSLQIFRPEVCVFHVKNVKIEAEC